jgi:hypothetical protein
MSMVPAFSLSRSKVHTGMACTICVLRGRKLDNRASIPEHRNVRKYYSLHRKLVIIVDFSMCHEHFVIVNPILQNTFVLPPL